MKRPLESVKLLQSLVLMMKAKIMLSRVGIFERVDC